MQWLPCDVLHMTWILSIRRLCQYLVFVNVDYLLCNEAADEINSRDLFRFQQVYYVLDINDLCAGTWF